MNSAQGVGVGIGIVILIFVIILGLNVYAISNLQFRAQSIDDFSIFPDLKMNMDMETCNPTFFPASYNAIYLDVYYKQNNLGTATMYGSMIPPGTSVPTKGNIDLHSGSVLGSIIDAIGSALFGTAPSTNDVKFKIKLDAPILGIIPFSLEKQYSYNEFSRMLEGGNDYGCSIQNPIPNFGLIESQFENEINSLESALDEQRKRIEGVGKTIEDTSHSLESALDDIREQSEFDKTPQNIESKSGIMGVSNSMQSITYIISGGDLINAKVDRSARSMILELDASTNGSLSLTIPRFLLDAKYGDRDDIFYVLIDGKEVKFGESKTPQERVLDFHFPQNSKKIEIIGTYVNATFG